MDLVFLTELAINGALTGLLYSLFALGLVLIPVATRVIGPLWAAVFGGGAKAGH